MNIVLAALFALLTAACAASTAGPVAGLDAADPEAPVPPVRATSTLGTYISQRPVDPAPWRQQNQNVTPKAKP
jgi:curli biogenesis system outer membrane secretion channel CsgG